MKRALTLVLVIVTLSGCATIKGWFNDTKKENIEPPTVLVPLQQSLSVQKMWSNRVGKGPQRTGALMRPAYADGKLFAASTTGDVEAMDATSGHTLWQKHIGERSGWIWHHGDNTLRWSGGPSVNGDLVVVGDLGGHVYALAADTGAQRWTAQVSSEVISAPALDKDVVIVRTNDGRVYGLNTSDGSRKWVYDHASVPILSLRGNSSPALVDGIVYFGADNGKVVAVRASDGAIQWEQQVSAGEGRTEIERLQDVDGPIVVDSGVVYASGYRGQTVALITQSGRPLWTHELSSYTGTALSASQMYVADSDSNVWALDLRSGTSAWKQDGLKYRWVSALAVQGDTVVVGDLQGFVHWLSINDGKFVARTQLSKDAIRTAPVVVGDVVYVEDVSGEIGAYRVGK